MTVLPKSARLAAVSTDANDVKHEVWENKTATRFFHRTVSSHWDHDEGRAVLHETVERVSQQRAVELASWTARNNAAPSDVVEINLDGPLARDIRATDDPQHSLF